jgi:hypothetical protein
METAAFKYLVDKGQMELNSLLLGTTMYWWDSKTMGLSEMEIVCSKTRNCRPDKMGVMGFVACDSTVYPGNR